MATDDRRIFDEVVGFGGMAEMTDNNIESGSARVWSVVEKKRFSRGRQHPGRRTPDLRKIDLRGVPGLAGKIRSAAARPNDSYEDFRSKNVVKVVCDRDGRALYFSRAPIPYSENKTFSGFFQHIGIYGYTREMLALFIGGGVCDLEKRENLEQLRFLFLGQKVHVIQTDFVSHGVDVPEDVKIEKLLRG